MTHIRASTAASARTPVVTHISVLANTAFLTVKRWFTTGFTSYTPYGPAIRRGMVTAGLSRFGARFVRFPLSALNENHRFNLRLSFRIGI